MKLNFYKMQGCGNDFLFLDYVTGDPVVFRPSEIAYLCDRHFGIGADGVVVLKPSEKAHAAWDFYNSDGSMAEMCGNAARCAIRFLSETHFPTEEPVALETKAGIVKGRMLPDGNAEVALMKLNPDSMGYEDRVLKVEDQALSLYCVNTGVPHAVIEVKSLATYPIARIGRLVQEHPMFEPEGTNVTFFQTMVGPKILSTTFERGVAAETFACGTGAAAAAMVFSERYLQALPVEVEVPGGRLTIDVSPASHMLLLQGPAQHVFQVSLEDWPSNYEPPTRYSEKR